MSIFRKIIAGEIPAKVVYEDAIFLAFLDISQATPGHTLIIPKEETVSALTASPELVGAMNVKAVEIAAMLQEKLGCKGFNFLTNANPEAGQTVPHYHIHIIPRYDASELKHVFSSHSADLDATYHKIVG